MSRSTGPILATGALAWTNVVVLEQGDGGDDWWTSTMRIALGTGLAAGGLALLERASEGLAVGLAWLTLVTTVFVRLEGKPTPAERLLLLGNKAK